jgi:hypothetical protein
MPKADLKKREHTRRIGSNHQDIFWGRSRKLPQYKHTNTKEDTEELRRTVALGQPATYTISLTSMASHSKVFHQPASGTELAQPLAVNPE